MVVELAVVAPVMIVVAIVVMNLATFMGASAKFDRTAPDLIIALAVSPAGVDAESGDQSYQIARAIEEVMNDGERIKVSVRSEGAWHEEEGGVGPGFSFAPHLTRYVCTLTYSPWPSSITVAGVNAGIPIELVHQRAFVIDRYRSGVLV